jgi:hypothetical protein
MTRLQRITSGFRLEIGAARAADMRDVRDRNSDIFSYAQRHLSCICRFNEGIWAVVSNIARYIPQRAHLHALLRTNNGRRDARLTHCSYAFFGRMRRQTRRQWRSHGPIARPEHHQARWRRQRGRSTPFRG